MTVTELSDLEGVGQSGVSRALARLEAEVGAPLLHRSGRTLRVTRAGMTFKRHVDAAVREIDDGLAAVQQLVDPETGVVSLAYQPSLGTWLVPDLVEGFRRLHPRVRLELRSKRDELAPAVGVLSGTELELTTRPPSEAGLHWQPLVREPLMLVVAEGHPLAGRSRIALAEVSDEPFVAIHQQSHLRVVTDLLCERAGFAPDLAYVCDDLPTMRAFVAAELGVAVLPVPPLRAATHEGLRQLSLTDPGAYRDAGIAWSAGQHMLPAARLFRDHVVRQRIEPATTDDH